MSMGKNIPDGMVRKLSTDWSDIKNHLPKNHNDVFIELVSNSLDAGANAVDIVLNIDNENSTIKYIKNIVIADDGFGMYNGNINDKEEFFAKTSATYKDLSVKRDKIGKKGRGRFSPFKIWKEIVYKTKCKGNAKCYNGFIKLENDISYT
jgi:HSP90 family molecular chaperone